MSTHEPSLIPPWSTLAILRPALRKKQDDYARYALHLGSVVRRDVSCPDAYKKPSTFFALTFLSEAIRDLFREVNDGLCGRPGHRSLQLQTPFGGGKTHTLVSLYHWAQPVGRWRQTYGLPKRPKKLRCVVLSGVDFDPIEGRHLQEGPQTRTLWGALAWSVGGEKAWERVRVHDERRIAPGGELLQDLLKGPPLLLLLDELLLYIEKCQGVSLEQSNFGRQNLLFLQTLTEVIRTLPHHVLVYSLQSTSQEAAQSETLLASLQTLVGRLDVRREPFKGVHFAEILRRHLFSKCPSAEEIEPIADAYAEALRQTLLCADHSEAGRRQAEKQANLLKEAIFSTYPFHPDLIALLSVQWKSIPSYQQTRGALRILSVALQCLQEQPYGLIGVGDLPLEEADVWRVCFAQLGLEEAEQTSFFADQGVVDEMTEWVSQEVELVSALPLPRRIATSLFLHSFGTQGGRTTSRLLCEQACPGVPPLTVQHIWERLRRHLGYIHHTADGFVWAVDPNLNRWLFEEGETFDEDTLLACARGFLTWEEEGALSLCLWPHGSQEIHDKAALQMVYLPVNLEGADRVSQDLCREWLLRVGHTSRIFRNALFFAVPRLSVWEQMLPLLRLCLAARRLSQHPSIRGNREEDLRVLKERIDEITLRLTQLSRQLYERIWVPVCGGESEEDVAFESVDVSQMKLTQTSTQARYIEALVRSYRLCERLQPERLVALFWDDGLPGRREDFVSLPSLRKAFSSYLHFPRLLSERVLVDAIKEGLLVKLFGYRENVLFEGDVPVDGPGCWGVVPPKLSWREETLLFSHKAAKRFPLLFDEPSHPPQKESLTTSSSQALDVGMVLTLDVTQLKHASSLLSLLSRKVSGVQLRVELSMEQPDAISRRWLTLEVKEPLEELGVGVELIEATDDEKAR